ncbi:hypothetical protein C8J57DRAFT_1226330 [Mycena rebaudengoi]|nr:hypothetical protein C8J57DRAFT_1226330 [Mycena rebaudengoi]
MAPTLEDRYDIFWSIAILCNARTQAVLIKTGRMGRDVATPLLYTDISVRRNARALLVTLASNHRLARMVKELRFEGDAYLKIDTTALDAALMKMEYLKKFVWGEGVGISERFIPFHAFKLNVFTIKWRQESWPVVQAFLAHQTGIERLTLWRAVYPAHVLEVQPAAVLPALRILDACPSDIARLIGGHNLTAMRFRADETTTDVDSKITEWDVQQLLLATVNVEYLRVGTVEQLTTLLHSVHWAPQAQRLALDQDNSWGERIYGVDVEDLDSCIIDVLERVRILPHLQTFAVISQEDEEYGVMMYQELRKRADGHLRCDHGSLSPPSWCNICTHKQAAARQVVHWCHQPTLTGEYAPGNTRLAPTALQHPEESGTRYRRRLEHTSSSETEAGGEPYKGCAPETEIETEWRLSMQGIADLAEEWVADGEEQWQKTFQILGDFVKEEYTRKPIPKLGTQAYWRHVEEAWRAQECRIRAERAAEWATGAPAGRSITNLFVLALSYNLIAPGHILSWRLGGERDARRPWRSASWPHCAAPGRNSFQRLKLKRFYQIPSISGLLRKLIKAHGTIINHTLEIGNLPLLAVMSKRKLQETTLMDTGSGTDSDMGSVSEPDAADDSDIEGEYFYESISHDAQGRNVYRSSMVAAAASPTKRRARLSPRVDPHVPRPPGETWIYDFMDNNFSFANDEAEEEVEGDGDVSEEVEAEEVAAEAAKTHKPRAKRASDDPLAQWVLNDRDRFLDELLRHEGRGDYSDGAHAVNPLHRIETWNDAGLFERKTLKQLGLCVQLGFHPRGQRCRLTKKPPGDDFVVIDVTGIHEVAVDYCDCGSNADRAIQLVRMRWFPATSAAPATVATHAVLRKFHLLTLESKCSVFEFYTALARETDNTGMPPRDRYEDFKRMSREWRNLQLAKRAGRGHDPAGCTGTKNGECGLLCPAFLILERTCHPIGKTYHRRKGKFLYALFLALDANFRMRRKDVSSEEKDPGLGDGWAFFGEVQRYMSHLEKNWDQKQERSTCVAHDALNQPDKEVRGTAASGIGAVDCARHNMKRRKAVGDLQKGERYLNMDYMFFESLAGTDLVYFFVSYDIACQWHKNIWERMKIFPMASQLRGSHRYIGWLVPKFHLPAHIELCNIQFSFLLTRYVGMTDGEAPERGWAHINHLATSTREMGPGFRRDVLDDNFNDWNWKKIVGLGRIMFRKIVAAIPEMLAARAELAEKEESLPKATLDEWRTGVEEWEADQNKPNPFARVTQEKTIASVRYELASEGVGEIRGETSSTEMIAMGQQLEEQVRQLTCDQSEVGLHPTLSQKRTMLERVSKLRRKVLAWIVIQTSHMPQVAVVRAKAEEDASAKAKTKPRGPLLVQDIELLLPSQLDNDVLCARELQQFEWWLREGQAHEALHEIRHGLLLRTHEFHFKDKNTRGVKDNTEANKTLDVINARIKRWKASYRAAHRGMVVLGERLGLESDWEKVLRPLSEGDVRGMPRAMFHDPERKKTKKKQGGRGKEAKRQKKEDTTMSWIWLADGSTADADRNPAMHEALRIEWAKARARSLQWSEEVDLLEEEMRRITQFLFWHASWWEGQRDRRAEVNEIR